MSAIPVRALLGGIVLGNSLFAVGQITATVLLAALALSITGQTGLLSQLGPSALVIGLGSRIHSNSLLRMGSRVKLREAMQAGQYSDADQGRRVSSP